MTQSPGSTPVRTLTGKNMEIPSQTLSGLQARLHGELLTPEHHGYSEARTIWNGMIDRRPGLIARCVGVADVMACVEFAREHELLLSIRGGGHNIAGLALCDGGMTIDMSLMRGVWFDRETNTAHAQAGCTLGNVDRETTQAALGDLEAVTTFLKVLGSYPVGRAGVS